MIVYDVIQVVSHDNVGSDRPGSHWVDSRDSRADAEQLAETFSRNTRAPTIRYEVEEIDELSPDRKTPQHSPKSPWAS